HKLYYRLTSNRERAVLGRCFRDNCPERGEKTSRRKKMRSFVWLSVLLLVKVSATTAQIASKPRVRAAKPNSAVSAREAQELRDAMAAQQQQMQRQPQQTEQLNSR